MKKSRPNLAPKPVNARISGQKKAPIPEGPARHLDASRQKLTPRCLAAKIDSQLPSPKLSLKMPPKLPPPTIEDIFSSFRIAPVVRVIARQLSGKNCPAAIIASRHQDASPGPLGLGPRKLQRKKKKSQQPETLFSERTSVATSSSMIFHDKRSAIQIGGTSPTQDMLQEQIREMPSSGKDIPGFF